MERSKKWEKMFFENRTRNNRATQGKLGKSQYTYGEIHKRQINSGTSRIDHVYPYLNNPCKSKVWPEKRHSRPDLPRSIPDQYAYPVLSGVDHGRMSMSTVDGTPPEISTFSQKNVFLRIEPQNIGWFGYVRRQSNIMTNPCPFLDSPCKSKEQPQTYMLGPQFCGVNLNP